jgi:hypothetical protein
MRMIRRIRELATPPRDSYDQAVLALLDDLDAGWARCAERVPDRHGTFLVYCETNKQMWITPFAPFGTRQGDMHERHVAGWYCYDGPDDLKPTHWRPLPVPPSHN